MNEIKTSEQVRAELEDKKVGKAYLSEFENGIKKELDVFKGFLLGFRPKHEIKHILYTEEIKSLNLALNEVVLKLEKISVPSQIELIEKKEHKISFSDATTKFLFWFCGIVFTIALGSILYAWNIRSTMQEKNDLFYQTGVKNGQIQMYKSIPKKNQKFIDDKYPNWRNQ